MLSQDCCAAVGFLESSSNNKKAVQLRLGVCNDSQLPSKRIGFERQGLSQQCGDQTLCMLSSVAVSMERCLGLLQLTVSCGTYLTGGRQGDRVIPVRLSG